MANQGSCRGYSGKPHILDYRGKVNTVTIPTFIANHAQVDDGTGTLLTLRSAVVAHGYGIHLPLSANR